MKYLFDSQPKMPLASSSQLISWTIEKARYLRRSLHEYKGYQFPNDAPVKFVELLEKFVCELENLLETLDKRWSASDDIEVKEDLDRQARHIGLVLQDIHSWGRYISAARVETKPIGMALATAISEVVSTHWPSPEDASGQNIIPVCIVRPQWKYNFKYVPVTQLLRLLAFSLGNPPPLM